MTNQKKRSSSNGSKKSGESFKERILRELHEGNRTEKSIEEKEEKSTESKGSFQKRKTSKRIQKRKKERARRKSETTLQREDRIVGRLIRKIVITIILFLIIVGTALVFYVKSALQPLDKDAQTFVTVHIPAGASGKEVAKILKNDQIIKNAHVFNYFVKFNNYSNFKSGYYNMKKSFTLDQIAKMLKKGGTQQPEKPALGKIIIKEGQNIDEIAKQIEINVNTKEGGKTPFKSADFITLMKDETFFSEMLKKYPMLLKGAGDSAGIRYRLEGYLCSATYSYEKRDTIRTIVEKSIQTMNQVMESFYGEISKQGKTVREVLTLASLVEKEAVTEKDRRMVAQVFLNRMRMDKPLETDISVLYALGKSKELVSIADTKVDSPYNLYQHTGVGPGPYDSPSKMSIEAVITPKENDYLYFLVDTQTGKIYYSNTGEEHMALVEKYINHH
ncbi:MAG: endolytic transglycosylase MltG [Lactobacillales bacterium]|nr:endolytic transglycosylase MltG [Lactobacillales bacterium]